MSTERGRNIIELAEHRAQKEELPQMLEQAIRQATDMFQALQREALEEAGSNSGEKRPPESLTPEDFEKPEVKWRLGAATALAKLNSKAQAKLTALQKQATPEVVEEAGAVLKELADRLAVIDEWRSPGTPKPIAE